MFRGRSSVTLGFATRSFANFEGVALDSNIETGAVPSGFVTHCGIGLYVYSDNRYTYVMHNTEQLPTMVTGNIYRAGDEKEVLFYLGGANPTLDHKIMRIETAAHVERRGAAYIVTDDLDVTVQDTSGAVTKITLPPLTGMIPRTKIYHAPAQPSDPLEGYNVRRSYPSRLEKHAEVSGLLPNFEQKDHHGRNTKVSNAQFTKWGDRSGPDYINRLIHCAAPMIVKHHHERVAKLHSSLCSMDEDMRIYEVCGAGCRPCAAQEGIYRAISDVHACFDPNLRMYFLGPYLNSWYSRRAREDELHECTCCDVPTAPPQATGASTTDEPAESSIDISDDIPPLMPLTGIRRSRSPTGMSESDDGSVTRHVRQRFNPEEDGYDPTA